MTMDRSGPTREVELVLQMDPMAVGGLRNLAWLRPALSAAPQWIRTRYFDTGDFAFRRRGFGFRVREADGRFLQTIKTSNGAASIVKDRLEIDMPLPGPMPAPGVIPDEDFRSIVLAQLETKPLRCVFETLIERRRAHVMLESGAQVELAFDLGEIRAGPPRMPVCEVELELLSGTPDCLFTLARQIAETVPVSIGLRSKAARGYALMLGTPARPVKGVRPRVDQTETVETVFAQVIGSGLKQTLANEPAILETHHMGGVHQMRVGLRRLRAALGLFRHTFGRQYLGPIADEAKTVATRLGKVRDLDVLVTDILKPVLQSGSHEQSLMSLYERVDRARQEAWEDLLAEWDSSSRLALFALQVEALVQCRPWREAPKRSAVWDQPIEPFAASSLQKKWRDAEKLGQNLDGLSLRERHELRIAIKKLRYTGDFFADLYDPQATNAYLACLSKLQDSFGALNDVATASMLLPRFTGGKGRGGKRRQRAMARVLSWHSARADQQWVKAKTRWADLCATRRFWERNA